MIIYIAHTGHEHANSATSLTHHIPAVIAITLVIAVLGGFIYWFLQRKEKVVENIEKES